MLLNFILIFDDLTDSWLFSAKDEIGVMLSHYLELLVTRFSSVFLFFGKTILRC
jgi:hypothetical protein